jgi:hypothetical protein
MREISSRLAYVIILIANMNDSRNILSEIIISPDNLMHKFENKKGNEKIQYKNHFLFF